MKGWVRIKERRELHSEPSPVTFQDCVYVCVGRGLGGAWINHFSESLSM